MIECNVHKYLQNAELRKVLESVDGTVMVEASPTDTIWGIGLSMYNPEVLDKEKWQGKNLLGRILQAIRESLLTRKYDDSPVELIQALRTMFST